MYPAKEKLIEEGLQDGGVAGIIPGSSNADEQADEESEPDASQPEPKREIETEIRTPEQEEEHRVSRLQRLSDSNLNISGIVTFEMPLLHFTSMHWTAYSRKADLVFWCITNFEDEDLIRGLPEFCKLVLNPGSYVFVILTVEMFVELSKAFKEEGFKVSEHPFDIIYDVSTVPRRSTMDFPQKHSDIALLCRSAGEHPSGFHPFRSSTGNSETTYPEEASEDLCRAHFASLLNASSCRKKLKRPRSNAAIFPWEKSDEVISRIVQTFCPYEGLVMDPNRGALTIALACLKTGRQCISIGQECDG